MGILWLHCTPSVPANEERARAAEAWRRAPGNDTALELARAYFPEFAERMKEEAPQLPVNPTAALRVKLPATEDGALEISTRGVVFQVRQEAGSTPSSRDGTSATFYGARHFWTPVGAGTVEEPGLWVTQRVEEYVVMEGGGQPFRANYEITVPESVASVRDAGDYLEFLDGQEVPVLRMHRAVARDTTGLSRQGQMRMQGLAAEPSLGQEGRAPLALKGRTLQVEMTVELEDLEGPIVVDPGWSSTGSMSTVRSGPKATLLPSGKVLASGGRNANNTLLTSAELYDPATGTWASTGSMASARGGNTATLLPNGKVLVAGGSDGVFSLSSAELYDPATGTWASTGRLTVARDSHTATLLPNGKVLVVGGVNPNWEATAELYDPATGTWAPTNAPAIFREIHTATLLPNGRVLIVGGRGGPLLDTLTTAEVYNPATGTWTSTGSMTTPREGHTATLLPNGKVLVAGGFDGNNLLSNAEVYNPATGTWTSAGSMSVSRDGHSATLLPDGKVLMIGGTYTPNTEVYDPGTGSWAAAGTLTSERDGHSATLLPNGKVLVAGSGFPNYLATAELYDPGAGTCTSTGTLASARNSHTSTLLPNGKVLAAGGSDGNGTLASAEVYDPATSSWAATGSLVSARGNHKATLLPNGKVLVTGGQNSSALASAEVYDSSTGTWTSTGSLASARSSHSATLLSNGKVLVTGGSNGNALTSAEVYDPAAGTWAATGSMVSARSNHTATLLPTGKVLVTGGANGSGSLASAEVYDPATGTWAATGSMASARSSHAATLLPNGKILVTGGQNGSALSSAAVYDSTTGTWTSTGSMAAGRLSHTATLLPTGKVIVAGGTDGTGTLASVEVYESGTGTWVSTGSMKASRGGHTATLLPQGKVLFAGGSNNGSALASAEVYEDTGASDAWRPKVQTSILRPGATANVTGSGFRGVSEASSGGTRNSATQVPLLSLSAVEGGALTRMPGGTFSDTVVTTTVPSVPEGSYLLTVTTNAIPGGKLVVLQGTPMLPPVVVTPASDAVVNTRSPAISGTAEAGSTVTVFVDVTVAGIATANGSGSWSLTPTFSLAQGLHSVTARATDAAGNTGPVSNPRSFTVDSVAPAAPSVVTPARDAVVNTATPLISGKAEAGSTVSVTLDGSAARTAIADGSGNWNLTPSTPLAQGTHALSAWATDAAGNVSPYSSLSFRVDSLAPAIPEVLTPANGAVVKTATPVISGTAEAGSRVSISLDGTTLGPVVTDGSRNWSFTPSTALAQGAHSITAQATDAVGNTSPASSPLSFTVDTVAPEAPVVVTPASGAVVTTETPVISGTAEAGSTVTVSLDGMEAGLVVADGAGNWSFTPNTALEQGAHSVTARATDAASNTSSASTARSFTVDTVAPEAPVVLTPTNGATVNTATPILSGTAEAGSTVILSLDGKVVGSIVANTDGTWSFQVEEALASGSHTLTVSAVDAVGNQGSASVPTAFTITLTQPPDPPLPAKAGGCTAAPTSAASWVAVVLAIACLRRRRALTRGHP